jgi:hypothetical protein
MMIVLRILFTLLLSAQLVQSTIQVIGTGTGRTGSTTLHEALSILGYKTYHMKEILSGGSSRAPELDYWIDAFTNNCSHPEQLKDILERNEYTATVHAINFPCHDALLFDLYPDAKVIHTERSSAELWHDSVSHSICKINKDSIIMRFMGIFFPILREFKKFTPLLMGRAIFGQFEPVQNVTTEYCLNHKEQMIQFYNDHNAWIKAVVPKDRLLVISNHKDGWEKLCEFLEVPVPDVPFPHVNKRESMLKTMALMMVKKIDNFSYPAQFLMGFGVCLLGYTLCALVGKKGARSRDKSKVA